MSRYFYGIGYDGDFEPDVPADRIEGDRSRGRPRRCGCRWSRPPTGRSGRSLDKLTLLCYRFDHLNQGYALQRAFWRFDIGGIITLTALVVCMSCSFRHDWRTMPPRPRSAAAAARHPNDASSPARSSGPGGPHDRHEPVGIIHPRYRRRRSPAYFETLFWYITLSTGGGGLLVYAALLYFCVALPPRRDGSSRFDPAHPRLAPARTRLDRHARCSSS